MVSIIALDSEVRGDTVIYDLTLSRAGASAGWMNGGSVTFMLKRRPGDLDADAIVTKTTTNGGIVWADQSAAAPTATVTIQDTDWALLDYGRNATLRYEVEIIDGSGRRETPQQGTLPILADIVRGA